MHRDVPMMVRGFGILLALLLLAVPPGSAMAATSNIVVVAPWARATPPAATVGAAYLEIRTTAPDKLLGASTPVAERIEMHVTIDKGGISQMRPLTAIEVLPGASITLAPGIIHLMLIGLKAPLVAGASFPVTLKFAIAGEVLAEVMVR